MTEHVPGFQELVNRWRQRGTEMKKLAGDWQRGYETISHADQLQHVIDNLSIMQVMDLVRQVASRGERETLTRPKAVAARHTLYYTSQQMLALRHYVVEDKMRWTTAVAMLEEYIGQLTALREYLLPGGTPPPELASQRQAPRVIATPEDLFQVLAAPLAAAFTEWVAAQPGLLERTTEQSAKDMSGAWFGGYQHGQKVMREGKP